MICHHCVSAPPDEKGEPSVLPCNHYVRLNLSRGHEITIPTCHIQMHPVKGGLFPYDWSTLCTVDELTVYVVPVVVVKPINWIHLQVGRPGD